MSMARYAAFLRAVNVGGRVVKMDQLRALCESAGLANVSTFIASGNVICESKRTGAQVESIIEKALRKALGYEVATMVRTPGELSGVVDTATRFADAAGGSGALYVGFLKEQPSAAAATAVAALSNAVDTLTVQGRQLYWQCRASSLSESTVTGAKVEKLLQVAATIRNVTTVSKMALRAQP